MEWFRSGISSFFFVFLSTKIQKPKDWMLYRSRLGHHISTLHSEKRQRFCKILLVCSEARRSNPSRAPLSLCVIQIVARAQASSRNRFHSIDLLSRDRGGGSYSPPSRSGPAYQSLADPTRSCDEPTTNLNVMVRAKTDK